MCRFLLAEGEKPFNPEEIIQKFADMSKQSRSLDGDWQGDGGGVSWMEDGTWQVQTFTEPFWEKVNDILPISSTNHIVIHARSASFPSQKGNVEYNQPYVAENYSFVFNGLLKGVKFPFLLEGTIGAQKIWSLLKQLLADNSPEDAIGRGIEMLNKYSKEIRALNLGLSDGENIYSYSQYSSNPEYYNLRVYNSQDMNIICSEELNGLKFSKVETKKIITV